MKTTLIVAVVVFVRCVCCAPVVGKISDEEIAQRAYAVLEKYCSACHHDDHLGNSNYDVLSYEALLKATPSSNLNRRFPDAPNYVVPGDPEKSLVFARILRGEMPPNGERPVPDNDRIALRRWIEAGAQSAGFGPAGRAAKPTPDVPKKDIRNVAIFVYDGTELLDFAGPGEVFAAARDAGKPAFRVYTVAKTTSPVISQGFLKIIPEFTFEDAPAPDVVVLPGGKTWLALNDPTAIDWIRQISKKSEVTMSVCTGAFLLAKADLLDWREATTHWGSINRLRNAAPRTLVLENQRFVDSFPIVSSAGPSSGIDAALRVVQRLIGDQAAIDTARYIEYRWDPTAGRISTPE